MSRNEKLVHWDKIPAQKGGKDLFYAVNEVTFTGKDGKEVRLNTVSVFFSIDYKDKTTGEAKKFKDYSISMSRLPDMVKALYDVDQRFNDGKAFAQFVTSRPDAAQGLPFDNDDIPF
jgi:hypothetical protein